MVFFWFTLMPSVYSFLTNVRFKIRIPARRAATDFNICLYAKRLFQRLMYRRLRCTQDDKTERLGDDEFALYVHKLK